VGRTVKLDFSASRTSAFPLSPPPACTPHTHAQYETNEQHAREVRSFPLSCVCVEQKGKEAISDCVPWFDCFTPFPSPQPHSRQAASAEEA
jgi:hypothetical protein